jgi:SAM-dependent methyltransferase
METRLQNSAVVRPNYSNWVSKKFIAGPGILALLFLGTSFALPFLLIFAIFFGLVCAYFAYAWIRFSPAGGNVQQRVLDLLLARLDWDGRGQALDIGCGNAPLAIKLAQRFPAAQVTGIDDWGKDWDYSKGVCEANARLEGVEARTRFQKASASALPFAAETFDLAVSNLVFHEVSDAQNKRAVIREALRVVKKGGKFVFQDLFLWEALYGQTDSLLAEIRSWGVTRVEFVRTCDEPFIPPLLKLPFMIGKIGIFYGEK